jgi:hypothetical protein
MGVEEFSVFVLRQTIRGFVAAFAVGFILFWDSGCKVCFFLGKR